jgi:hexosaminidase
MPGLTIYYTFDGTDPDNFYPEYSGLPLDIPKGASEIRTVSYRHGRLVSRQINYLLSDLKKDLDKK